jgi:imidazolonepropionase-like amidohydrolase
MPSARRAGARVVVVLAAAAGVVLAAGGRHQLPQQATSSTPLVCARLFDPVSGRVSTNQTIVIRGDRIERIEAAASETPRGAIVLPASMTVLPGLIDVHTHITWPGPGDTVRTDPDGVVIPREPLVGAWIARRTLEAGFTTVRSLGSRGLADVALRDAIANGHVIGPRLFVAGSGLGPPKGVCDSVFGEATASGPDALGAKAAGLAAAGVDWIKACAGGGVRPSEADRDAVELSADELGAIVHAAHAAGKKLAVHAQGPRAIRRAVEAGADSIEHGGMIDAAIARLMQDKGTFLVPTLARLDWAVEQMERGGRPAQAIAAARSARDLAYESARTAIDAGVSIALGTDATVLPHGLNAREAAALARAGLTPLDALRAATTGGARLLGLEGRAGVLRPGAWADVIAVEGSPLDDLSALERVRFVLARGIVVKQPL